MTDRWVMSTIWSWSIMKWPVQQEPLKLVVRQWMVEFLWYFLSLPWVSIRIVHLKSPCRILVWGNHFLVKSMARYSWGTCWSYDIFFTVLLLYSHNCVLYLGGNMELVAGSDDENARSCWGTWSPQLSSSLHHKIIDTYSRLLESQKLKCQHKIMINSRKGSKCYSPGLQTIDFCLQVIKTLIHEYPSALIGVSPGQLTKSDWWIHNWKLYADEENHNGQLFQNVILQSCWYFRKPFWIFVSSVILWEDRITIFYWLLGSRLERSWHGRMQRVLKMQGLNSCWAPYQVRYHYIR